MFGSKQKPKTKLDSKVRFQHQTFTSKVKQAQSYKRSSRPLPETEKEKWLAGLGLDSWWSRALVIIGIGALIYIARVINTVFKN